MVHLLPRPADHRAEVMLPIRLGDQRTKNRGGGRHRSDGDADRRGIATDEGARKSPVVTKSGGGGIRNDRRDVRFTADPSRLKVHDAHRSPGGTCGIALVAINRLMQLEYGKGRFGCQQNFSDSLDSRFCVANEPAACPLMFASTGSGPICANRDNSKGT